MIVKKKGLILSDTKRMKATKEGEVWQEKIPLWKRHFDSAFGYDINHFSFSIQLYIFSANPNLWLLNPDKNVDECNDVGGRMEDVAPIESQVLKNIGTEESPNNNSNQLVSIHPD